MQDPKEQERVKQLLSTADKDGDGTLSFRDFLHLMREYQDEQDERALKVEQEAAKKAGFSREEVEEFRMVFNKFDVDKSGELDPRETKLLFEQFTKVSEQQLDTFIKHVEHDIAPDGSWMVRFPSFLIMMRMVLDNQLEGIAVPGEGSH